MWRFLTFLSASEPFDVLFQDVVGRVRHSAVVIALHLIDGDVGMPREFQHAPKIGLFLVAAIEFFLPVAGNDDERRSIRAHVGEWCVLVDGNRRVEALFLLPLHLASCRGTCHKCIANGRNLLYVCPHPRGTCLSSAWLFP